MNLPAHPLPPAILFDLDDTIVAYDTPGAAGWRLVCEHFGAQVPELTAAEFHAAIKRQADWYWADPERHRRGRLGLLAARAEIIAAVLKSLGRTAPALAHAMAQMRTDLHTQAIEPFPGAIEALHRLRTLGVRLGLITNGAADAQRAKIRRFKLETLFDSIVVEGEFGCGKPDERVFHHALAELRATAADAWMVGDNLAFDIAPAQALGLTGIWHDWQGRGLPAEPPCTPHRIIRRISELISVAGGS
jgi:putative hydrolase of the HAD superfamily